MVHVTKSIQSPVESPYLLCGKPDPLAVETVSQLVTELRFLHLAGGGAGELVGFAEDEAGGDFVGGQAFAAEGGEGFGGERGAVAQLDGGDDQLSADAIGDAHHVG